jgi:hypothetical protein
MSSRWSGILIGTMVCLAVETMLIFLGVGVGLIVFPFERIGDEWQWIGLGIGSAIYLGVVLALSFFTGGFVASRLHLPHQRGEICFQGLGMWGTATGLVMVLSFFFVSKTVTSAGAGAGMFAALETVSKTKPRIITDFSIFKGKAVTSVDLGASPDKVLATAKKELSKPEAKEVAEKARKATATLSLGLFFGMLIGLISSATGAWYGRPTPVTAVAVPSARRTREAA